MKVTIEIDDHLIEDEVANFVEAIEQKRGELVELNKKQEQKLKNLIIKAIISECTDNFVDDIYQYIPYHYRDFEKELGLKRK